MGRGRLIVFEGIEGSGKSTQAKLFYEELLKRGEKCIFTAEPTDSPIGKMIRELLKSGNPVDIRTLQLLFIADRSHHIETLVKPKMEEGYTVITDRYAPSTIVYGNSFGGRYGLKGNYLMNAHKPFLAPDLLFFINITPERALERIQKRGGVKERFDELKSLKALDRNYQRLSKKYYPDSWRVIEGDKDIESVKADLLRAWEEFTRVVG
jgi:dTMP kinase